MGWGIWIVRLAISLVLGSLAAWGISFTVADYVSEKHVRGLTVAVDTLTTNISDLNSTVTAINTNLSNQLIALERERATLAIEIAKEVEKLRIDQGSSSKDIEDLRDGIERIEMKIAELQTNMHTRITFDGGKTFEDFGPSTESYKDVLFKLNAMSDDPNVFAIAPYTVLKPSEIRQK